MMKKHHLVVAMALTGAILLGESTPLHADGLPPEYQACVEKGLKWLAKRQFDDGHWDSDGNYNVAMTALCGMCFLMEGSTMREGPHSDHIRRAVEWLVKCSRPNGLIGDPRAVGGFGGQRYMYGHGFALMFLSCIYGDEGENELHRKLQDILTRAVIFTGQAQSGDGGWGYLSARDGAGNLGNGNAEGSVTITQMQAVRAARNAGIVVPKEIIDNGIKYLKTTTNPDGGIRYTARGSAAASELALTSAAVVCGFSAGEYESDLVKKWIHFISKRVHLLDERGQAGSNVGHVTHSEYTFIYLAQLVYNLGDDRFTKLFPESRPQERLTWSKFRKPLFDRLKSTQEVDGSWKGSAIGIMYTTALHLAILQLDKGTLPIYQR